MKQATTTDQSNVIAGVDPAPPKLPVRVALLTNFIPPYLLPVLTALSRAVTDLQIYVSTAMEKDRHWEASWGHLNVQVQKTITTVRRRTHLLGFSSKYLLHFPYDTLTRLSRFKPDVVLSAQLGLRTIQSSLFKALHPQTGLILWADLSEHTEIGTPIWKYVLRQALLRYCDAILVNGESGARFVVRSGADPVRVVRMPYVRDMNELSAIPLARGANVGRRLLYVGQLSEGKGVHLLLDALVRQRRFHPDDSCELWIAGDGPMRKRLQECAKKYALSVNFLGNVPFEELHTIYASAGIFVFPTLSDTWGVVVNEALASGLPVLGSCLSQAVEELVHEGYNGWKFRPDRAAEFDAVLERVRATPAVTLDSMRGAARSSIMPLTPDYAAAQIVVAIKIAHDAALARARQ